MGCNVRDEFTGWALMGMEMGNRHGIFDTLHLGLRV